MYKYICLIVFTLLGTTLSSQEFNATVRVSAPTLTQTDPAQIKQLEIAIQEFLNTTAFTEDRYEAHERIELTVQLTITNEKGTNSFSSELSLMALRPVFGSDYKTPLLNYQDQGINFTYEPTKAFENNKQVYRDNLSAVLSYYVYLVLGLDYDSFEPYGGDLYFQIAQSIVNSVPPAQVSANPGWDQKKSRNRYWLIENLLNPKARQFRGALYEYHLKGLDMMSSDSEKGKVAILNALESVQALRQNYPTAMVPQFFARAKGDEIVEIFGIATPIQKAKVYQIMSNIDPAGISKYAKVRS